MNKKPQWLPRQVLLEKVIEAVRKLSPEQKVEMRKNMDAYLFKKS